VEGFRAKPRSEKGQLLAGLLLIVTGVVAAFAGEDLGGAARVLGSVGLAAVGTRPC
jgi:hypothetical protein